MTPGDIVEIVGTNPPLFARLKVYDRVAEQVVVEASGFLRTLSRSAVRPVIPKDPPNSCERVCPLPGCGKITDAGKPCWNCGN